MRAYDILLFLVCLEASIGFVASLDLFSTTYVDPSAVQLTDWNVQEIQNQSSSPSLLDTATDVFVRAIPQFLNMLLAIAIVYIPLTQTLGVPTEVALLFQGAVYLIYVWAIIQFLTGRSVKYME